MVGARKNCSPDLKVGSLFGAKNRFKNDAEILYGFEANFDGFESDLGAILESF